MGWLLGKEPLRCLPTQAERSSFLALLRDPVGSRYLPVGWLFGGGIAIITSYKTQPVHCIELSYVLSGGQGGHCAFHNLHSLGTNADTPGVFTVFFSLFIKVSELGRSVTCGKLCWWNMVNLQLEQSIKRIFKIVEWVWNLKKNVFLNFYLKNKLQFWAVSSSVL